ncbi:sugar kinase [Cryobacterium zhongshanensis]|uniref:Sugar kinase n=1 Tax=Cryobacterium zhongshanensis TaxID=2928153 RepID=A0AA41QXE4_9MICO|nr:sugar kinase [Cryobacterium zhongshanensis]MCI4659189.1 sugar kinase [Cryobacterium zhongshanensis]
MSTTVQRDFDVVTFGEIMAMFVAEESGPLSRVDHFVRRLAGAEFNVAVGLRRLDHSVGFVTRLGTDPFGEFALQQLEANGIDVGEVDLHAIEPTGFQLKNRPGEDEDPLVVYFRSHSAARTLAPTDATAAYVRRAGHVHLTGIPLALGAGPRDLAAQAVDVARETGATVSFDPNLRPSLWADSDDMVRTINTIAVQADWVLPGMSEGRILTGETTPAGIARWYLDRGVTVVAVKAGSRGAELFAADGTHASCPPFAVSVVDTVGAGDGFSAGLLSAALDGLPPAEWVYRAGAVGALATTSRGDQEGLPDRAGLATFLEAHAPTSV